MMYTLILTLPKSTCAKRGSRSFHLYQETTADALTGWYCQDQLFAGEDIEEYKIQIPTSMTLLWNAPSYSNPRCPSKGVWDILYYSTYVTAVFRRWKCDLTFWTKIQNHRPAFSCGIPFEISHDLVLTVSSLFSQRILENLELDCTPKFECNGAWIADATSSPVSWACMNIRIVEPTSSLV